MSKTKQESKVTTLRPDGNISGVKCQELRRKIERLIEEDKNTILIDMIYVELLDSSGIGMILAAQNELLRKGGKLQISNLSENILLMLQSVHLDKHIEII